MKKSLNPTYYETFWLVCNPGARLTITVYDWDRWSRNDVCGSCTLDLAPLQLGAKWQACRVFTIWQYYPSAFQCCLQVPLTDGLDPAGCVLLQLLCENKKATFGLDLQALCEREGRDVPSAVVTLCQALDDQAATGAPVSFDDCHLRLWQQLRLWPPFC